MFRIEEEAREFGREVQSGGVREESVGHRVGPTGNITVGVEVSEKAREELWEHIGWGDDTDANQVEQGGLLVGHINTFGDVRYESGPVASVERIVPNWLARGSIAGLYFSHESWKMMLDEVDRLSSEEPFLHLVGWYHTHPRHLAVFLSQTDRRTQERLFYEPWHIALVANPQKRLIRTFCGRNGRECQWSFRRSGGSQERG